MNTVNIDLGWLGNVVLKEVAIVIPGGEYFVVTHDGYTESGIRVYAVLDGRAYRSYPKVWNNSILIRLEG